MGTLVSIKSTNMYATYVYLAILIAAFGWWLALFADVSVGTQIAAGFLASMATGLLVLMGLYELTVAKKKQD